jgi:hypothetical protein
LEIIVEIFCKGTAKKTNRRKSKVKGFLKFAILLYIKASIILLNLPKRFYFERQANKT